VTAEAVDALGRVHGRTHTALEAGEVPQAVADALATAAGRLAAQIPGGLRLAVVSAADPVDRETGRLVQLPDAPFLVGELDPPTVLAACVSGPVLVDNDVNWAARAEHQHGCARGVDDFVYLHLGAGLGCAVVNDGVVRRGRRGLVGEIAHLCTHGPDGEAMAFTDVFAALGLRRPSSTAVDVPALRELLAEEDARARRIRTALARAIGGVLSAAVSLADPQLIVIGGEWGTCPGLLTAVEEHFCRTPRPVSVTAAALSSPELSGARIRAVEELGSLIVHSARPAPRPADG
jgi:predicted NBD/HSP70 family sugar kinase